MLEKVDLTNALSKAEYKQQMPKLQERLRVLQTAAFEAGVPTIIVLEGWDAAGKGSLVQRLLEKLDPRGFKVRPTYAPSIDELYRPFLWRFWARLPAFGEIAVFDRSWYGRVMVERVEELATREQIESAFHEINEFERMLSDSGNVIVKLFLHISKKEQRRRFRKCEKDAYLRWKVKPEDWRHYKQYGEYHAAVEEMLEKTSTQHAPWHICECEDRRFGEVEAFTRIIEGIETRLKALGKNPTVDDAGRILKPKAIPAHLDGKKPERRRGAPVAAGPLARAGNGKKR
jgi:polyphosphate kinase 2 (PPK2 family)